ncbi:MAG: DUF4382 domain-containing protein [Desulfobacterales bacterium]|nr:MAG: DUF4382 domain-containing protein [Desulfobacterales bacterium]
MRLIIADEDGENYLVVCDKCKPKEDCHNHDLIIPSGFQMGVKLVHPFTIQPGDTTELILDFEVAKSIVEADDKYLLKPTIKVMGTHAVVQRTVKDEFGNPLDGATVSAQTFTDADHVVVHSTTSTTNGSYAMHLPPGPYCIVAYKGNDCDYTDVYGPSCQTIVAESDTVHTVDFTSLSSHLVLTPAISTGKLTGHVTSAEVVTLSFRQSGCVQVDAIGLRLHPYFPAAQILIVLFCHQEQAIV